MNSEGAAAADDARAAEALVALLGVMQRLRDPDRGCPWDREQNFASIAPHTLEEAYEVSDAIAREDWGGLSDELGDLLFQIVFYAQLGREQGRFDFAKIALSITDKLMRRHPHVFAAEAHEAHDPLALHRAWEHGKAAERAAQGAAGALDGVALALPALTRAAKLGKRAARVGFDWATAGDVANKVDEERAELAAATTHSQAQEEFGDLLFALAQYARHLDIDPEAALRAANSKFERRFGAMETKLRAADRGPMLSPADWDALWNSVKLGESRE